MSMRSLHMQPPPGAVLQAYMTPGPPGAGVTHYLMYDSADEGKIREWLSTIALNLDQQIIAQAPKIEKTPQVGNANICAICQKPGHSAVPHPDNPNWSVCPVAEQKPNDETTSNPDKTSDIKPEPSPVSVANESSGNGPVVP